MTGVQDVVDVDGRALDLIDEAQRHVTHAAAAVETVTEQAAVASAQAALAQALLARGMAENSALATRVMLDARAADLAAETLREARTRDWLKDALCKAYDAGAAAPRAESEDAWDELRARRVVEVLEEALT